MRVLHIFDHSIPLHSGYSFRSLAILREQRRLGIDTWQVTSSKHYDSDESVEEIDGWQFYRTRPGTMARMPILNQYDVIRGLKHRLQTLVEEIRPDILHAHSPSLNALAAATVARRLGLPLVYEMRASWEDAAVSHGTCRQGSLRYRLSQALEKRALARADHVVTICNGLAGRVKQWGVDDSRITVVPNGVDLSAFSNQRQAAEPLKQEYRLQDKTVLGFLGSFYRYEGLHLLIDALPAIAARLPAVHLLLVGGGQEEATLKQQVIDLGLADRVTFTGRVPHRQINDFYNLVDLFVYPRESILLTEIVTPLKPLEAMANGGLVIASDIGGHREMIEPGQTGLLFRPNDPSALAEAAIELLLQPQRWQELRNNGRRYVESERCWSRCVAPIQQVYERLMTR
ncbi:TIGR04063 family PEP-CTERM/XrtA system glycosyltransferase [Motiliproteus sediminis]|uniref:TIGR04063 family PEP-CTERM/XrtA system glycosyltransferase n=1 Tax=Motiliproteus sediminis TaxID=1468178 RepID=UPI001AF02213|nr:TIGR04063 family PEP-CTERM/XrtA system glycosyltransferase [Motiliproteus sediminis]